LHNIGYLYLTRADLDAELAVNAFPDLFVLKVNHAQLRLVYQAAGKESTYLVPGAGAGARAALVARFKNFSAFFFYDIGYIWSNFLHCYHFPSLARFTLLIGIRGSRLKTFIGVGTNLLHPLHELIEYLRKLFVF
jgi:hypothetical protein